MPKGIASCPNCTTMIPVTALAPLHRAARIDRMVVSTYQSVSGAGQVGLHELDAQWTKLDGRSEELRYSGRQSGFLVQGEVWDKPIAGNVIPLAGSVKEQGYTSEEWKMVRESRKILHDDEIRCTVTCVRVPVYVGHAVSANVRFHRPMAKAEAVELLRDAPGVLLVDDGDGYPTPQEAAGIDPVLVGPDPRRPVRARIDRSVGHRRQPAQGCGPERRPDGGAPARPVTRVTSAPGQLSGGGGRHCSG